MFVDFHILNELGSPSINSNTFANRPPAGQIGRLFVSTDTYEIYRDNGSTWDLIGGPGSSTVTGTGAATQVAYWTASQAIGGSNNLWWDNTNGFLGIKTNAPTAGVNVVQTDGLGILAEYTTVAGVGGSAVAIYARNTTNSSGYSGVFEEKTPNSAAGQYPVKIMHSLSSGTAAANMATGIHFSLPDDAGTERINQFSMDTVDPAAATYTSRYRFVLRNAGAAATPFYITGTGIGVYTAAPSGLIHADGGASAARMILDADAGVARIFSFRSDNLPRWALRVDGAETGSNAGADFSIRRYNDAGAFIEAPLTIARATGKSTWAATETYSTGVARGNYLAYNLTVPAGASFSSPNAITALGANLNLQLQGNATIPSSARVGLDAYNTIGFTGAGTLTMSQGGTLRTVSNFTTGWAFNGSAAGTITHLSGIKVLFPDNVGSAVSVTNNYGILINNQDAATGTITYTNRWGIYQEGASDLNYFAANTLIGTTVNNGNKLQVSGTGTFGYVTNNTNAIEFLDSSSTKTHIGSGFGGTFIQNNNYYNGSSYVFDNNTLPSSNITLSGGTFNVQTGAANTNPSTKLTVDLAGNLGLGVTPSVWSLANASSLQIKNASFSGFLNRAYFGANFYWNNFGQEQYIANDYATLYTQATGQHIWYTAPSGTAGNAISFTQAMTLTSAGTLLIGTTTDAGQKLQVNGQVLTNREGLQFPAFSGGGNWQIGSDSTSGTGMYIYSSVGSYTAIFATTGNLSLTGSLTTGTPTGGTAAAWKLGSRVAATVVVNTTEYIEVDIGGTLYKLATVT